MTRRRALSLILALTLLATVSASRSLAGKTTHTVTITSGPSGTVASTDATFAYAGSVLTHVKITAIRVDVLKNVYVATG